MDAEVKPWVLQSYLRAIFLALDPTQNMRNIQSPIETVHVIVEIEMNMSFKEDSHCTTYIHQFVKINLLVYRSWSLRLFICKNFLHSHDTKCFDPSTSKFQLHCFDPSSLTLSSNQKTWYPEIESTICPKFISICVNLAHPRSKNLWKINYLFIISSSCRQYIPECQIRKGRLHRIWIHLLTND